MVRRLFIVGFSLFVLLTLFISQVVFADTTSTLRPISDGGNDSASWTNTDGTSCDSTDCYLEIDESSGGSCTNSDGNTSYIGSNTNGANQTFDIDESVILDDSVITGIDVTFCARRTQGGSSVQARYCLDASCSNSGASVVLGVSYSETTQSFTGLSITKSASTDLEIGISNVAAKGVRISQISTVITYTLPSDTIAPSAISDLALSGATQTSIDLDWTSPGDDASSGTATSYDIRYSTSVITAGNFSSATQVSGEPTPGVAGTAESMIVSGLSAGTTYFFAVKTNDEVPNTSAISNVPSLATSATADTTAPSTVSDLSSSGVGQTSVNLSWTAPGDDASSGTATSYDIRYSTSVISDGNWNSATQATGEPTPSVAGTGEALNVTGLTASTLYYFAIKTSDEVPNESTISNIYNVSTSATLDTTAPSAVSDLALSDASNSAITASWTAPGDDADSGTATSYDLRYSTSVITAGNFSSAIQVSGEPTPSVSGTAESKVVSGLSPSTTYFFALKISDEVPNTSAISNVPSLATSAAADTTAPSAVSDLALSGATQTSIDLDWTAPGDDGSTGTASTYDIRYSTSAITSGNFGSATAVTGEPTPSVSGTAESMTVSSLTSGTSYFFAMKTDDEVSNTSEISNVPSLATSEEEEDPNITISSSGGGGGGVLPTRVSFSGQAYPGSKVEVLRKSQIDLVYKNIPIKTSIVNPDGTFSATLVALLGGEYFFALRIEDKDGRKTGIIPFGVNLLSQNSLIVKDIFVPPTIGFESKSIKRGDDIHIAGYAGSGNVVQLYIDNIMVETTALNDGSYLYATSTTGFKLGNHNVRVRQINKDNIESNFSTLTSFRVSLFSLPQADLNNDNSINIIDWSIFLFRWGSSDISLREKIDLNNDGKITIIDFSVFLRLIRI